jgi:hypothetical protein
LALVLLTPEDLETLLVRAVRLALASAGQDGLVDQRRTPLGPRRHADAVKRRLARGEPGASKVGRRYLLTPDALQEELANVSAATAYRPEPDDPGAKLRRDLGL